MVRHRRILDAEVWLDPADWEEVCALTGRVADVLHRRARAPRTPGSVHASATLAMFELDKPMTTRPASAEKEPDR
jgi:hypothetical protein